MKQSKETKKEFRKVIVEGISMYASVHAPKKAYDPTKPPEYVLDLIVDAKTADKLIAEGLKPAKTIVDEDTKKLKEYSSHPGQKVFTLRRKTIKKDGSPMSSLEVIDSNTTPIPKDILIGNGSKVRVAINPYSGDYKGKPYNGHNLLGVQVLELVAFTKAETGSGLDKTKGFTVTTTAKSSFTDTDSPFEE